MPRRKRIEGEDGAVLVAGMERPDGIAEQAWAWCRDGLPIPTATALHEVTNGERPIRDDREAVQLLEAATRLQGKYQRAYVKLRSTIGRKLAESKSRHAETTGIVADLIEAQDYPSLFVDRARENGHDTD